MLALSFLALFVLVYSHCYLIIMAVKMQRLFRQYGHIKGYCGEILIAICYSMFCFYLSLWYLVQPITIVVINTSDYECSNLMKSVFMVLYSADNLVWPLSFQLIFCGFIW